MLPRFSDGHIESAFSQAHDDGQFDALRSGTLRSVIANDLQIAIRGAAGQSPSFGLKNVASALFDNLHNVAPAATAGQVAQLGCAVLTEWLRYSEWALCHEPGGLGELEHVLVRAWGVEENGPGQPDQAPNTVTTGESPLLGQWVDRFVVHRTSGRLLSGRILDPSVRSKLIFIATRISNLGDGDLPAVRRHSNNLARQAYGIGGFRCHETVVHCDPALPTSHDDGWRNNDEDIISCADLVVILWDAPADGFGAVVELARRYQVPWVVVRVGPGRLSPMLLGKDEERVLVLPEATYLEEFAALLGADPLGLKESQARRRAALEIAAAELESIRAAMEEMDDDDLTGFPGSPSLTRTRFRRLVSQPNLWRGATGEEQAEIRALAQCLPPLEFEEAHALSGVISDLVLDADIRRELERAGRRQKGLASTGKARFDGTSATEWLHLLRGMKGAGG